LEVAYREVRNRIPGVVNPDKQEEKSRRTNHEKNSLRKTAEYDGRYQE
jgi:hypothetical protein